MSVLGKWRITRVPDYVNDYPDMLEPAFIRFGKSGGEFAFGCVNGVIHGHAKGDAVVFTWTGSDEMDQVCGRGKAELQENGTLEGQICFDGGDDVNFTACRWRAFSTAC